MRGFFLASHRVLVGFSVGIYPAGKGLAGPGSEAEHQTKSISLAGSREYAWTAARRISKEGDAARLNAEDLPTLVASRPAHPLPHP